jgi:hypothetical protein
MFARLSLVLVSYKSFRIRVELLYSCGMLTLDQDNEDAVHDMPVNLQLVGRRLEEEKVLMMTETILEAL